MNGKRKLIVGVLAFLVVMTMGYALFSETVTIGGTAKGDGNLSVIMQVEDDYHYIDTIGGVKINKLELSPDKKSFDLNVTFDYPGSFIAIPIRIINNGSINAYLKDIKLEGFTNINDVIKDYENNGTILNNDGIIACLTKEYSRFEDKDINEFKGMELLADDSSTYHVLNLVIFWNDLIPNKQTNLTLNVKGTLEVEQLVNSDIPGDEEIIPGTKYGLGNEFCFGNECFTVLSNDGTNVRALANKNITTNIGTAQAPVYPKQSDNTEKISFSNAQYWLEPNSTNLLPKYKDNYSISKYGYGYSNYVYDNNSNLYPIIKKYEEYLKNILHVNVVDTGLALVDDLENAGCEYAGYGLYGCYNNKVKFKNDTCFWLGNVSSSYGEYYLGAHEGPMTEDNSIMSSGTDFEYVSGVRPLIKIPISEITKTLNKGTK